MRMFFALCLILWASLINAQQPQPLGPYPGPVINIKNYGAIGDGTCHQLSSLYPNLAAAQIAYPFVRDLTQCGDWAATQQAINVGFANSPANASATVYCPSGNYIISNPLFFDQANNSQGSYAAWAVGTTYGNGANVTYNGIPWVSMGSGNVGNPPTSQALFPQQLELDNSANTAVGYPWSGVTISNGSPAVVTIINGSSLATANEPLVFFTNQFANPNGGSAPALPTGINANQVYYIIGSSISGNTFHVSTTPGGAAVNTSSAGVGNFFATPQVWQVQPVSNASVFSNRVTFIGDDGLPSNGGCRFTNFYNWTTPTVIVGPQNGILIKSISLNGQVSNVAGANGYRCTSPISFGNNPNAGTQVGSTGWAIMATNGGSSFATYENVGASGFAVGHWQGYGGAGVQSDTNTWIKPKFHGNCINLFMSETQAYINTIYDGVMTGSTTSVIAAVQEGVKIIGGNYSSTTALGIPLGASFAVTSVSFLSSCGTPVLFGCIQATITSPDNNFQQAMCAYSAGQPYNAQAHWLNAWYLSSGCGYNTFVFNVPHWGAIGAYIVSYNPTTKVAVFGIPQAYAGIYQGTCCGSDLGTQVATVTTMWAVESAIAYYGQISADTTHIESDGTPTTLSCFCTTFFGATRPAELKNTYLNSEVSLGSLGCCNRPSVATYYTAAFYGQQVIPYINSTVGDTIMDHVVGGQNLPFSFQSMDRALIAVTSGSYLEARHSSGTDNGAGQTSGSAWNPTGPFYDFAPNSILETPLVNPSTKGQMSGGYMAMGGSALGSGLWDNGSDLGPYSVFSKNLSTLQQTDMANVWRMRGWGQAPQWGVRPAPWANPCILPSQNANLVSPPAITYVATLQDFVQVANGGAGYAVNDVLTLTGGTFTTAGQLKVTAVSGGVITAVQVVTAGAYTNSNSVTTFGSTGGSGNGAATFTATGPIWYVNYNIPYPMLWGGTLYRGCDYNGFSTKPFNSGGSFAISSSNVGYSYFQALTTTNVPHLSWTMDGASPFIYMNYEALELMFPGLVFGLVSDGTGGCTAIAQQNFMVLEVHPTLGYVKVVRVDNDGSNYVPSLAASGTICKNVTIAQQSPNLIYPY